MNDTGWTGDDRIRAYPSGGGSAGSVSAGTAGAWRAAQIEAAIETRMSVTTTALENLLVHLNDTSRCAGNVRVMAHSMGNVVTGEALRRLGTNCIPGTDQKFVKTYIAMQGAIPAHCYDRDSHFAPFPWNRDDGTWNPYSYYWSASSRNYMADLQGAGANWNYCNALDYALDKWIFDQQLKPDGTLSYFWSTSRFPASGFYRVQNGWAYDLNFPNDAHEIFAFGAEPRSFALGASTRVAGFFSGQELNLETTFEFGRTHNFHSKQFRSTIALQWEFWKQVRLNFELNQ